MKQTAVEWLESQLKDIKYNPLEKNGYSNALDKLYAKAKAMEKEQIETAWHDGNLLGRNGWVEEEYNTGSQYYKQTYGGDK